MLGVLLFVLGLNTVFVSYGLLFGGLGSLLLEHSEAITRVLGVVTILLGLLFAGWPAHRCSEQSSASAGRRAWAPTLAAVQFLAFDEASAGRGALLSFAYALGLPFLAAALAYQRAVTRAGGIMLIVLCVLLVSGPGAS